MLGSTARRSSARGAAEASSAALRDEIAAVRDGAVAARRQADGAVAAGAARRRCSRADFFEADGRARDGQVRGAPADDGAGAGGDDDALDAELAADLDATKASLDAALEKDRELNAFNTTICAFIETIAGDGSSPQASPAKKKQPAVSL
ncbi:hypothetical protein JL720_16449 [Aureococcus anophagefferens]|nr:hypothetical protein JL720_16449 [Aureococcus anophagefferens]